MKTAHHNTLLKGNRSTSAALAAAVSCLLAAAAPLAWSQSSWSYDFTSPPALSLPTGWTFNDSPVTFGIPKVSAHYGISHSGDPDGFGLTMFLPQGTNGVMTAVDGNQSFNLQTGSILLTMGWSPQPKESLTDNGFAADNELAQIGLVDSTTSLLGLDPSMFLSVIEDSADVFTDKIQAQLAMRSNLGILDYYDGGATMEFSTAHYYIFSLLLETNAVAPDALDASLKMDVYAASPQAPNYSYVNSKDFGTLNSLKNQIAFSTDLYPALGMTIRDASKISVSGTNFDMIPEPTSGMLGLLGGMLLLCHRRRGVRNHRMCA